MCFDVTKEEERPSTTWVEVTFIDGCIEGEVDTLELIETNETMQNGYTTLLYVTRDNVEYAINTANILYIKTIK